MAGSEDISSEASLLREIELAASIPRGHKDFREFSNKNLLEAVQSFIEHQPLTPKLREALKNLLAAISPRELTPDENRELSAAHAAFVNHDNVNFNPTAYFTFNRLVLVTRTSKPESALIDRLEILYLGDDRLPKSFNAAEPWAAAAQDDIGTLSTDDKRKWNSLFLHLQSASGSKPSQKWLKQSLIFIDDFSQERFKGFLVSWLPLTLQNRKEGAPGGQFMADQKLLFSSASEISLKGLAWAASHFDDPAVAAALGDLGEASWRKVHNHGPRSKLAGNAALWALSAIGSTAAIAQLTRINSKLKHASARKLADSALNRVAESTGKTREDLEELAVPTFEMSPQGTFSRTIDDFNCTLSISPQFTAEISIIDASAKERKTVPAPLKSHADFKALQKTLKQLNAVLASQRLRIESVLRLPERSWSYADWQARYKEHPLIGRISRRLIWKFTTESNSCSAMLLGDSLSTAHNTRLPPLTPQTRVQLWHPCNDTSDSVLAWRTFLNEHQISQPFKQAYREIYLLTDAERRTATYSNRFAAHVIRQHQFSALCAARGWNYRLQGSWDGEYPLPTLEIPSLNLKAEFWVDRIGAGEDAMSASGVALNLTTDQVRIYRREPAEPLHLGDVPAQVFSEILRDVDLFVGVASVGNDPSWNDGGPDGRHQAYWQSFSFGDLTETAKTRKAVLETLIPRLKIAKQCALTDKFLRIQGALRAYKIHLGSGNILMEPNDQYLCIVANRSTKAPGDLFLPFEGDATLTLILSKAFLLAQDHKITDETILRQIRP